MINLVYASSAASPMPTEELAALLRQSQRNNASTAVTGMLVHRDGSFLQVLEGEESAVASLYETILGDARHTGALRLLVERVASRNFPAWTMGFRDLGLLPEHERAAASPFLGERFSPLYFGENPAKAQKLLLSFRKTMR